MNWFRKMVDTAHAQEASIAEDSSQRPESNPLGHHFNNWQPPLSDGPHDTLIKEKVSPVAEASLDEYERIARSVGLSPEDIAVERFKALLQNLDLPVFELKSVVRYMDNLVRIDNPTGLGWHWCPVRAKDTEHTMRFGTPSSVHGGSMFGESRRDLKAASDYYQSHDFAHRDMSLRMGIPFDSIPDFRLFPSPAYTRTIPIHALRKIALIEEVWKGPLSFLVTDYTLTPHVVVNPDPFLMAVVPNPAVGAGKGRFVIDVWDEPGFGLAERVGL